MEILNLMQRALDKTNDPDAIFALDRGITEIERLRDSLERIACFCQDQCKMNCAGWIARAALRRKSDGHR